MTVADNYVLIIVAFLVGITFFLGFFYLSTLADELVEIEVINDTASARGLLNEDFDNTTNKFDGAFVFIVFLMIIVYWITTWLLGTNPIFIVIHLVLLLVGIIASFLIANVWETVADVGIFGTTVASMPAMNHILSNLPLYTIIFSLVGLVLMFGKPYVTGEGY